MKLQYLKRNYLYSKVLKKTTLPKKYVFILFTVNLLAPAAGFRKIEQLLNKVNRQISRGALAEYLTYLIQEGYIERNQTRKFIITAKGLNELKDIERRLRIERHDR